jgi:acyl dehydratase
MARLATLRAMKIIESLAELPLLVGQELAVSDWFAVTQQQIDLFADATGDHQWIHVDPVRAKDGPFGGTIAHGFLTLALIPKMVESCLAFPNVRMSVNYGLDRVRFPAPVPAGSRLRSRVLLLSCEPLPDDGLHIVWRVTVEREGSDKPACVAESVTRRYG